VKRLAALVALVALAVPARAHASHTWQGTYTRYTMPAGPTWPTRDYFVYVPPSLPPAGERSLVVFLHGCTQDATEAALGVGWNDLADARGFVVAYPEQSTGADGSAAQCWNEGQPLIYSREEGELRTIAEITRAVASTYGADAGHVYVTGISSGALMSSAMAASYPDLYAAAGSVAGCGYQCADPTGLLAYLRMGPYARPVPAFVVQGTTDDVVVAPAGELAVEQWVGTNDLADDGSMNGSVSHVPDIENHVEPLNPSPGGGDACIRPSNNPCPGGILGLSSYPYTVRTFARGDGTVVVEAWLMHGLMHNYPHGNPEGTFTDPLGPDVNLPMYDFFEAHAR
jgi:poly(3-hydroxybutyrate) depolymerase